MAQKPAVEIAGLRDLQRDIRKLQPELRRDVPRAIKDTVDDVVTPRARTLAPHRTGRLAASLRTVARGNRTVIVSRLPYANFIHWGGTTGRGHSRTTRGVIRYEGREFITKAVAVTGLQLVDGVADRLDRTFQRNGWHG